MKQYSHYLLIVVAFLLINPFTNPIKAQNDEKEEQKEGIVFENICEVDVTPVKNQSRSGTCWSFATVGFLEAEILRETGKEIDLSEMYFVRHAYPQKAMRYIRQHGRANFGAGGQAHDVTNVIRTKGVMLENDYPALLPGEERHTHSEMDAALSAYIKSISSRKGGKLSQVWMNGFEAVLDTYLGDVNDAITTDAVSLWNTFGLDIDNYVEFTSYAHYPMYSEVALEVPDNWSKDIYYNVPLDDLIEIMKNSLKKGYTIVWDGDVSSTYFNHKKGMAIVPEIDLEKEELAKAFKELIPEEEINQENRQLAFENQSSTDDHLMLLSGLLKDANGIMYFKTKNSWGEESNTFGGYLNMSESYVRLNTVAIMVHKDAIPKSIAKKLKK